MIIASSDNEEVPACELTIRRLGVMIATGLLLSEEKERLEMTLHKLTEPEAQEMISYLEQYQPTMGYHSIPLDVKQQGEAIRYAVTKDNFYERNITSGNG